MNLSESDLGYIAAALELLVREVLKETQGAWRASWEAEDEAYFRERLEEVAVLQQRIEIERATNRQS